MTVSVATLKARVKRTFNDLGDTAFLEYLNEAHAEILETIRLIPSDAEILSAITTTDRVYSFDDDILRVFRAVWYESATEFHDMQESNIDELDQGDKLWRQRDAGYARKYYQDGNKLGIDPLSVTATSGGYPKIVLYVSRAETLDGSDSLPTSIKHSKAWRDLICLKHAEDKHPGRVKEFYDAAYGLPPRQGSIDDLRVYTHRRLMRQAETIRYKVPHLGMPMS